MRRTVPSPVLFPALLLLIALNALGQQPVHGLWVWKTPSVLAAPHAADNLRDFCRTEHVNEVYVAFTAAEKAGPSEENQLAALIHVLHESSIHVEALISSTDADESGKPRDKLLGHIRDVIAFNHNHGNDRFDGIHLDIEPQQRPENKGPGNLKFLGGLVEAYRAARHLADPVHLTVNADIQKKLLEGDLAQRRSLLSSLSRITLMLYELSSPNDGETPEQKEEKLRRESGKYMDMAYQGLGNHDLAKMAIGLRTPDYGKLMPRMLATVDETLRNNPHYLGWAWHSYNDH
ncbi:MAG TPA: hypothetical protein VE178_11105 [Silvibacterium sp.]|jgi:hypothetical protein|nr:hypothetical protein [Silvibacterium sp.]